MRLLDRIYKRLKREANLALNGRRLKRIRQSIKPGIQKDNQQTVVFFNASTRLSGLSQNAGFSLVSALALEASGFRTMTLVCESGMSHCVLGTNNDCVQSPPPCGECIRTSRRVFNSSQARPLKFARDLQVESRLRDCGLDDLLAFAVDDFPVGRLVWPSLRWVLRKHHLSDDADTRYLAREYILSALNLKRQFEQALQEVNPGAVVIFNGMFYPEAALRWVAQKFGIPAYSHEVGMLPLSAFFTAQEATAYPVRVDESFRLSPSQNQKLDEFLSQRMEGKFVTAGVKFWPEMKSLGSDFWQRARKFKFIVPIFTNVVFDTSQSHANVIFDHMFQWLDEVLEAIRRHPEVFFVIRAHPDEMRPGKESRETVSDWAARNQVDQQPNVFFITPHQYASSYELIQHAKFVAVYNSTIGLEASILGKPVLCGGRARYTQIPTVFFPKSKSEFTALLEQFLKAEAITIPEEFRQNARRVLYSQLFRASLPFDDYLEEDGVWRGYVRLKDFSLNDLLPEKSSTIQVILEGIQNNQPFIREL